MSEPVMLRPSVATVGEAVTPWADSPVVPLGELSARVGIKTTLGHRVIQNGLIVPVSRNGRGSRVLITQDDALKFAAAALIAARKALPFLTVLALLVAVGATSGDGGTFTIKVPD